MYDEGNKRENFVIPISSSRIIGTTSFIRNMIIATTKRKKRNRNIEDSQSELGIKRKTCFTIDPAKEDPRVLAYKVHGFV